MSQLLLKCLFFSLVAVFSVTAGDRLPAQIEVTVLEQGQYCGDIKMGAQWLKSGELYQKFKGDNIHLLLISMGQQRSGGYSLALLSTDVPLVEGIVPLQIAWNFPRAGMMTTQAITQPCLLLALKSYRYNGVRIVDQQGVLKTVLSLPSPK